MGVVFISCNTPAPSIDNYLPEQPYELITGIVTDSAGTPLEGILVVSYFDKQRTQRDLDFITESDGKYFLIQTSVRCGPTRDIYLEATDPAGKYAEQSIDTIMVYDSYYCGSLVDVNFVMVENQ